jgi:hypothetical protein
MYDKRLFCKAIALIKDRVDTLLKGLIKESLLSCIEKDKNTSLDRSIYIMTKMDDIVNACMLHETLGIFTEGWFLKRLSD